ncbi:unnamed protein product [Ectocarpus sp. CCAP 1310/34]|nr:unnamed protein product [Ectocarpus sp. CCAP 1310/34]
MMHNTIGNNAHTLEPQSGGGGKKVVNFLLAEIENRRGELVVAFAGYAKNMESLFEFNEGLPSRFPKVLRFEDYSDALLLEIFKGLMAKKKGLGTLHCGDSAEQEDPERWAKVAIARLGRRRGSRGFGNARAVQVLFDQVLERQASRLSSGDNDNDNGNDDDDDDDDDDDPYELTKPDLLGWSVSSLDESESWRTLRDMVGLGAVKSAVLALAEVVQTNRVLEEAGKPPRNIALNRCMLGNPGTGKTTVAKLIDGILADLGLLPKGEVVLKTASDFVGSVLGESESKTRAILKAAEGCVLVIDEAYSLRAGSGVGGKGGSGEDPYRTAVVDTLVEQVQNVPGEDRCVLLLGYRAEMEEFMRDANPGLARRFALDNAFSFENYKGACFHAKDDEELLSILRGKLRREHLTAGVDALMAAADVLRKKRKTASHFGNGGEVANLLSEAKLRKESGRRTTARTALWKPGLQLDPELLPQDFDPEYGAGPMDGAALEDDLFGDLIGCADIKLQLTRIRSTFVRAQRLGRDPREAINLSFYFTGVPGTGKTTVAQRVGRMFKQVSVIHSDDVVSCPPSDFTTGSSSSDECFVGQAALKTKEILDKAIGKVLFIDEAYGLNPRHGGGSGFFMQDAPRFGNGRTITDLAANHISTEIGMRMGGDGSVQQDNSGSNDDHRASVEDIRRSATAVLQQMARIVGTTTNTNSAAAAVPEVAFCTGTRLCAKPPKRRPRRRWPGRAVSPPAGGGGRGGDEDEELLATLARVRRAKEAALKKARNERERQLAVEAASRLALARMGVCPAGRQWIRQGDGWRCGRGTHYVSGSAVAAEMARGGGGS